MGRIETQKQARWHNSRCTIDGEKQKHWSAQGRSEGSLPSSQVHSKGDTTVSKGLLWNWSWESGFKAERRSPSEERLTSTEVHWLTTWTGVHRLQEVLKPERAKTEPWISSENNQNKAHMTATSAATDITAHQGKTNSVADMASPSNVSDQSLSGTPPENDTPRSD